MNTHQRRTHLTLDLAEMISPDLVLVLTCTSPGCGLSFEPTPARRTPARLACPRCDGLLFTAELDLPLAPPLGVGVDEPVPFVLAELAPVGMQARG
ncbi:MAG: hypothetical protein ACRDTG_14140 [Pseudonocardiaceae bacterium]